MWDLETYLIPGEERVIERELFQSRKNLVPNGLKVHERDVEVSESVATKDS